MCSIEEPIPGAESEDAPVPKFRGQRRLVVEGKCHKCKTEPPVVDMKRVMYCKACFKDSIVHRFRTNIMRATLMPEDAKVMLAFSGGPSSRLLLQLLTDFHDPNPTNTRKKQRLSSVEVCHIDHSGAVDGTTEHEEQIRTIGEQSPFTYHHIKLESAFETANDEGGPMILASDVPADDPAALPLIPSLDSSLTPVVCLKRCLTGLHKPSSKEDMLHHLTHRLLLHHARKHNCNVLLFADNATRLAIKVISATSKGRGFGLPMEVASELAWEKDMLIVRPLKDVLAKEVGVYNRYAGLDPVVSPTLTTAMPGKTSIDRLTEEFVVGLQNDFPMTVPTVVRTGAKVCPSYTDKDVLKCPLCNGPVQLGANDWRAKHTVATLEGTKEPSQTAATSCCGDSGGCGTASQSLLNETCCSRPPKKATPSSPINITPFLCYPCQNLCRDAREFAATPQRRRPVPSSPADASVTSGQDQDKSIIFPPFVGQAILEATREQGRQWMRGEIEEFLIDEDE
ncbi:hypothetical protein DFS34DRAFT_649612 [Phlyctochytrium arcticum]|nr:hypothetical protein DFS34DRAFT_649612 [Phlyctochytrium arcticum]